MPISDTTLLLILLGVFLVLVVWFIRTELRLSKLLRGKDAKDLEESFQNINTEVSKLKHSQEEVEKYLRGVEKRLKRSVQGVETIRFNAFSNSETGSNQSFATALLNEAGDGVVLSSLYARDRVSVFSKPVKNRRSEYELTEEEKSAVAKAEPSRVA